MEIREALDQDREVVGDLGVRDEVVPGRCGIALSAAPLLGAWIAEHAPGALLLGPDEEALQWVRAAAQAHGMAYAVCSKLRHADRKVEVTLPEGLELRGRAVVLFQALSGRLNLRQEIRKVRREPARLRAVQVPGRVVIAKVKPGDIVAEGQECAVMEAMKMELSLKAPRAGTVKEVRAAAGDFVEADAVLVVLE